MKNLIGNTNEVIDWDSIIKNLNNGKIKTVGKSDHIDSSIGFDDVFSKWNAAGYFKINTIEWTNFYPDEHYDKSVDDIFSNFVKMKCARSWISMIQPGKCAPIHQDIDDHIDEYKKLGSLTRFTCHIGKPEIGHIFLLEKDFFHKEPQGSVYKWDDYASVHAGGNLGWNPKYLYNFLGYEQ
jgi:hypothetical protein